MIYIASLGYSLHVSNDQNKKNGVRKSAKTNLSGTISKGNNAIQNSTGYQKQTIIIVENMMREKKILNSLEVLIQS